MPLMHISDDDYFSRPGVSNSLLSRFAKCPANSMIQQDTTRAMILGSAFHAACLEGKEVFLDRYYVVPKMDMRTKEGKAAIQTAEAESGGRLILTTDEFEKIVGMSDSVASHPSVSQFLATGEPEVAIFWNDSATGIDCKGKADWISKGILIDLKTTQDSGYSVFSKTITNMGYFRQLAMYRDGLRANLHPVERCIIIAVSSQFPYETECYELDEELLEYGQGEYKRLLREYQACCEAESFPAYRYAGVHTVRLPAYLKEIDG